MLKTLKKSQSKKSETYLRFKCCWQLQGSKTIRIFQNSWTLFILWIQQSDHYKHINSLMTVNINSIGLISHTIQGHKFWGFIGQLYLKITLEPKRNQNLRSLLMKFRQPNCNLRSPDCYLVYRWGIVKYQVGW